MVLSEKVLSEIEKRFPEADRQTVRTLLAQCQSEQICIAILRLCRGKIARVEKLIEDARLDVFRRRPGGAHQLCRSHLPATGGRGAQGLRRGAANAWFWFSVMGFTVFIVAAWFYWSALELGAPARLHAHLHFMAAALQRTVFIQRIENDATHAHRRDHFLPGIVRALAVGKVVMLVIALGHMVKHFDLLKPLHPPVAAPPRRHHTHRRAVNVSQPLAVHRPRQQRVRVQGLGAIEQDALGLGNVRVRHATIDRAHGRALLLVKEADALRAERLVDDVDAVTFGDGFVRALGHAGPAADAVFGDVGRHGRRHARARPYSRGP